MPFNGSGVFTPKHTWVNESNSGTAMLPDRFDDQDNDFATGLSSAMLRDGTGGPTADIPWNNFGITGLRAPSLGQDAANKAYVDTATAARSMGGFQLTNLAAPVAGTDAVNLTFLQQYALNAALPGISAGVADYVTTNNGSNGSWTNTLKATVIRFKDGADATKLLAFDLSGLSTGTTRTIAIPDKSGTLAMTADIIAANGASMALLAQATVSSAVANIDFLTVCTAGYDNYVVFIDGAKPSANDTLTVRFANAGVIDSGTNYLAGGGTATAASSLNVSGGVTSAGLGLSGKVEILNVNSAAGFKTGQAVTFFSAVSATDGYGSSSIQFGYLASNTISGLRLYWGSGSNFTAGTVRVYGIKNS